MRGRAIALYCLLTYALGWSLQLVAIRLSGGDLESDVATPWLIATMFTPMLATVVFLLVHRPSRAGLLWKPTWRMIPMLLAAVLIPTLIAFAVLAVITGMGWGESGWFSFTGEGATIAGGPWLLGQGAQAWPLFLANVLVTGAAFAGMSGLAAVGEEFGWRAFLQGQLIARLGVGRGVILLGLLWAFWHLPGLLSGYNYPETPLLGALVIFPVELVAVSLFMAWLTLSARSFWPAVIAHGAGNSIQEGVIGNLQLNGPRLYEDLTTMGVTAGVGMLCWAALCRLRPAALATDRLPAA